MPDWEFMPSRRLLLKGATAAWLLSLSRSGFAASSNLLAVRIWPANSYTRMTLESRTQLKYRHFMLGDPHRLVVDIDGMHDDPRMD